MQSSLLPLCDWLDEGAKEPIYKSSYILPRYIYATHLHRSKMKEVMYAVSQTICNSYVLSAVSFQINLW